MGDKEQCFYVAQDKRFHPNNGVDIQMVGGFIQQENVGVADKRACK